MGDDAIPSGAIFRGTTRAQSQVIGAILVFAILILLLAVIQVTLIPQNVAEEEAQHSRQAEGDISQLAGTIREVSATGQPREVQFNFAPSYEASLFFLYPPEPAGSLRTSNSGVVEIDNLEATNGEARDYWNSSATDFEFEDNTVTYQVEYNRYTGDPTFIYENSVLVKNFSNAGSNIIAAGQSPVQGRRVSLTLINRTADRSQTGASSLSVNPVSTGNTITTVTSRDDTNPVVFTVPTDLTQETWCSVLGSEIKAGSTADLDHCPSISGTSSGHVVGAEVDTTSNELELELEGGVTYLLDVSAIAIEQSSPNTKAEYIVIDDGSDRQIAQGTTGTVGAQVLDQYGNPVSGVRVNFSLNDSTTGATFNPSALNNTTTNENGIARIAYTPSSNGTKIVRAEFDDGSDATERAKFTINTFDPRSGGAAFLLDNGASSGIVLTGTERNSCPGGSGDICVTFENTAGIERNVSEAQISFYWSDNNAALPSAMTWDEASTTYQIGGQFENTDFNISTGTNDFDFSYVGGGPYPQQADFFVINFKYGNGQADSYLVVL